MVKGSSRESESQYQLPLADTIKKEKKEKMNKTEISGCGSFVVAYFQPATSIDRLHSGKEILSIHLACDLELSSSLCQAFVFTLLLSEI